MALADQRPDAERLGQFAEGGLNAAERTEVERHLVDCEECRTVAVDTIAFLDEEKTTGRPKGEVHPFPARRWAIGVVAALGAAAMLVLALRLTRRESRATSPALQGLVAALANEGQRPVDGRLTGGFKFAPPPTRTRGSAGAGGPGGNIPPAVRLAALSAERLAASGDPGEADAVRGAAALVVGDVDRAIAALTAATRRQPTNAARFSDLAAALLERADLRNDPNDLRAARTAAEEALKLDPRLREALFNRALALGRLRLDQESRDAWRRFAEVETDPAWLAEAARLQDAERSLK